MNNSHSPRNEIKKILAGFFSQRGEASTDYCFFVPCFGLGDRLAYLAAIPHLRNQGLKLCVLAKSGDAFLASYQEIFDFVVLIDGIELSPWVHGDGYFGPANIFFLWHQAFDGGIDLEVVFKGSSGGHKLAAKASLGLDVTLDLCKPGDRFLDEVENKTQEFVFLSPIANSSPAVEGDLLAGIISFIRGRGFAVVLNVSDKNRIRNIETRQADVRLFEGDLWAGVGVAKKARLCINARSGFSEVLSATGARFIDIYPSGKKSLFWSLKENFFTPPLEEFNAEEFSPELLDVYL